MKINSLGELLKRMTSTFDRLITVKEKLIVRIKKLIIMNLKRTLSTVALTLLLAFAYGQNNLNSDSQSSQNQKQQVMYKHSLGASLFMLYNLSSDPADYYLLTYGYQLTQKDRIFIEFNTWKYEEPIGTYGKSEELYPGYVRAFGVGAGYQRFFWKGLFSTIQATPFMKQYFDEEDKKIQKGFQLYLQFAIGYRFEFFKKRFYVEPAYALKYWPVDTNFPADFAEIEKDAPKFIFEPSLNFGFKF